MDTASVLATLYGRLIEIAGEKAAVSQSAQMTLIRASSNEGKSKISGFWFLIGAVLVNRICEAILDQCLTFWIVRTPVDAIVNYLDQALDNSIDHKTREILEKAQHASNSLINVTDDLLRLTEGDDESTYPLEETFNLKLTGKSEVDSYSLY